MEALFKKYFWVIKTLGIATACGLAASAVTTQLGARVLFDPAGASEEEGDGESEDEAGDEDEDGKSKSKRKGFSFDESALTGGRSGTKARAKERTGEQIRKHNIFCPTCVPVVEPPPESAGGVPGGTPLGSLIQPGETRSKLPLRLMATMEAVDPDNSFATILDTEVGVAGLFGRGDEIRKGVLVMGVAQGLVHLKNNAALEYIELGGDVPPPRSTSKPKKDDKKSTSSTSKNSREIPGAAEAINCPNENTCTVERAFVEKLMANPALLAKQARIVPKQKDGEVLGYKLYGIRRGSLPKLLGLKNGDMVTAVNGEDLKSMDKAMALYTKLRRASNLSVSIERKGKTVNKEIQIQ
ncbi:MAG: type II secretion system protein GspC [Myxococcota bacterium]